MSLQNYSSTEKNQLGFEITSNIFEGHLKKTYVVT